jgi:ABC-2 type transport system permease protein
MTTTVLPTTTSPAPPRPMAAGRYRFADIARSELTKFTSVRSGRWTLAAFAVLTLGLGVLVSHLTGAHYNRMDAADRALWDPTNQSLAGLAIGELALGILGVLVMSGEYGTGAIRSTLAAVPRRPLLLATKAAVFGAVALVVGEVVTFVTFLAGQAVMGPHHTTLGQPGVLRAVVLSGAYLALIGLFGLGLGTIIRHSAGAIATFVGIVLLRWSRNRTPSTPGSGSG